MTRIFKFPLLLVFSIPFLLLSCGKEKNATTEKVESVTQTPKGQKYLLDIENSKIEWKGFKIFKSESTSHFGTIHFKNGELTIDNNLLQSGTFVADMSTLENVDLKDDESLKLKLENHLKNEDFFQIDTFPTATFQITKVSAATDGDYNSILDGNLTIKNVTKPIQFKANVLVHDDLVTIATEPTDINREDFGVKFQAPVENGVIKNEVNLQVLIKANAKK